MIGVVDACFTSPKQLIRHIESDAVMFTGKNLAQITYNVEKYMDQLETTMRETNLSKVDLIGAVFLAGIRIQDELAHVICTNADPINLNVIFMAELSTRRIQPISVSEFAVGREHIRLIVNHGQLIKEILAATDSPYIFGNSEKLAQELCENLQATKV